MIKAHSTDALTQSLVKAVNAAISYKPSAEPDYSGGRLFSGFRGFDFVMNGLSAGDVMLVDGQSPYQLDWVLNLASRIAIKSIGSFNLLLNQVDPDAITSKLASIVSGVPHEDIAFGRLTAEQCQHVSIASTYIISSSIHVLTLDPLQNSHDFDTLSNDLKLHFRTKVPSVLVIDAVDQLLTGCYTNENALLMQLKAMAIELNTTIIACHSNLWSKLANADLCLTIKEMVNQSVFDEIADGKIHDHRFLLAIRKGRGGKSASLEYRINVSTGRIKENLTASFTSETGRLLFDHRSSPDMIVTLNR